MGVKFANNAYGTLNASITNADTSLTLSSGQGARFPSLGAGDYFYVTLIDTSNNLEIAKCTARSSDVLTITRGQEGTTARSYSVGDRVELRITSAALVAVYTEAVSDAASALDGDKGDITVSASGTNWQLDANVVGANELNVSGNGTAGQALLSDGDGTMSWGQGGNLIAVRHYTNSTRTGMPGQTTYTMWSVTDVKERADTYIFVQVHLHGFGNASGACAPFVSYNSDTRYSVMYPYTGHNYPFSISGNAVWTGVGSGNRTLSVGWNSATSGGERPFAIWNPNTSDDNRQRQSSSTLTVFEYLP